MPANPFERFIVLMDQIAGILVVVAAAWLVWTRPGRMSWGFFLYVMWFNPGQYYAFYALLAEWPLVMLGQNIAGAIAEAGYTGLLQFVLRVPDDEPDRKWRWLERLLPVVAVVLAALMLLTYGNLTGYRTETGTRFAILAGFAVAVFAVGILLEEDAAQTAGGLSAHALGGVGMPDRAPSLSHRRTRLEHHDLRDEVGELHAIGRCHRPALSRERHPLFVRVRGGAAGTCGERVDPLRRVTILGLTLSVPALLLHHEVEYMQEHLAIPNWAWIVIGAGALYLISRLHEGATHLTDRYFNRDLDHAERSISAAILKAKEPLEVDRILADRPYRALKLSSAASFRRNGAEFRRDSDGHGWGEKTTRTLLPDTPMLAPLAKGAPFPGRRGIRDRTRTALRVQPPGARGPGGKSAPLLRACAVRTTRLRRRPRRQ